MNTSTPRTKHTVPHFTSMSDDQALRMLQMERHSVKMLFADVGRVRFQRRDRKNDPNGRRYIVHVPFVVLRIVDPNVGDDLQLLLQAAKNLIVDRLPEAMCIDHSVGPRVQRAEIEFFPCPRLCDLRSADLFLEYNTGRTNRDAWTTTRSPLDHCKR